MEEVYLNKNIEPLFDFEIQITKELQCLWLENFPKINNHVFLYTIIWKLRVKKGKWT